MTTALADLTEVLREISATFATSIHRLEVSAAKLDERQRWLTAWVIRRDAEGDRVDPISHELALFSQNGEDGILLTLLRAVGTNRGRSLELGSGDATECITAMLALTQGWTSTFVEGDPEVAKAATLPVTHARVTAENVTGIVRDAAANGSLDVLAIDLDGNDYWVWEAIADEFRPAVVVVEYNASFGPDICASIPYDPDFRWPASALEPDAITVREIVYQGASLAALTALARRKGYALVGCDSSGVNAFFVRDDYAATVMTRTVAEAWRPCSHRRAFGSEAEQYDALMAQPLVLFDDEPERGADEPLEL